MIKIFAKRGVIAVIKKCFFDCAMPKRNPTIAHRKPESVTRSISFEVSVLRVESVTKPGASMPTSLSEKITRIKLSIRKWRRSR